MPTDALLTTKLFASRSKLGQRLVSRPGLVQRLDDGLSGKLTLVSAPAGFGKTTLVSEWLQANDGAGSAGAVAWLSLDEGDNDPARFLAYITAALQTVDSSLATGLLGALQSSQPPPAQDALTSLINAVAEISGRIVLVLDDYHLIETPTNHDAIGFLLDHLPPHLHLVIATREDPPLPLARLRARGQLTELRASDLRFASAEAAEFLNRVMGLDLSAEDVSALERRTEGWIAGLQLAAISMQGQRDTSAFIQSFTGSHRFVLDYLIEEVLEQQPEDIQRFLLQTAVLDRLTGPLCDAVRFGRAETPSTPGGAAVCFGSAETPSTPGGDPAVAGRDDGQTILDVLERANLFVIPLDNERRWYRYHHLFADLLRQRLRQTDLSSMPSLHSRASDWYETNGFTDESIDHALRAEDFERAACLVEGHADEKWAMGGHAALRNWLGRLPAEMVLARPNLALLHAWFLHARGTPDAAEEYLRAVEQGAGSDTSHAAARTVSTTGWLSDHARTKLRGRAAVIRAFMASYTGNVPAIVEYTRGALEYLPEEDLTWRSSAAIALGDAQGFKGDMAAAYCARLEAAEASSAAGSPVFAILAYIKVAITLREQGRLQEVTEICQQQLHAASSAGLSRGSVAGCLRAIWGEVLVELGDVDSALDQASAGAELAELGGDWSLFGWSCLCLARTLFSTGDWTAVQQILDKMERIARRSVLPPWITNQMAAWQSRLWLAQGELEPATQWLYGRSSVTPEKSGPAQGFDFFTLDEYVVRARILVAQTRIDEAAPLLRRLSEAADAGGRTSKSIEIRILQAMARQAGGETDRALVALGSALTLARPGGFVQIFVDEGPPMARLLHQATARGIESEYARRLLAAFANLADQPSTPPSSHSAHAGLIEPLSERELEVLELIAGGLTNREIAARLYLSLNTVKAHSRNIYGKLGVHSRTQAVARSREIGLLPLA